MNNGQNTHSQELEAAQRPVLKILQHKGSRLAVKLEGIFWSQLAEMAKERKTRPSNIVFEALETLPPHKNKTSFLRCLCLDSLRRRQQPMQALINQNFDLMAIIASCPSPIAIMTIERKIVAINPSFSDLAAGLRQASNANKRAINMSFSEALPKIVAVLIAHPQNIKTYQVGVQIGDGVARQFPARFALVDRSKKTESLIVVYLLA